MGENGSKPLSRQANTKQTTGDGNSSDPNKVCPGEECKEAEKDKPGDNKMADSPALGENVSGKHMEQMTPGNRCRGSGDMEELNRQSGEVDQDKKAKNGSDVVMGREPGRSQKECHMHTEPAEDPTGKSGGNTLLAQVESKTVESSDVKKSEKSSEKLKGAADTDRLKMKPNQAVVKLDVSHIKEVPLSKSDEQLSKPGQQVPGEKFDAADGKLHSESEEKGGSSPSDEKLVAQDRIKVAEEVICEKSPTKTEESKYAKSQSSAEEESSPLGGEDDIAGNKTGSKEEIDSAKREGHDKGRSQSSGKLTKSSDKLEDKVSDTDEVATRKLSETKTVDNFVSDKGGAGTGEVSQENVSTLCMTAEEWKVKLSDNLKEIMCESAQCSGKSVTLGNETSPLVREGKQEENKEESMDLVQKENGNENTSKELVSSSNEKENSLSKGEKHEGEVDAVSHTNSLKEPDKESVSSYMCGETERELPMDGVKSMMVDSKMVKNIADKDNSNVEMVGKKEDDKVVSSEPEPKDEGKTQQTTEENDKADDGVSKSVEDIQSNDDLNEPYKKNVDDNKVNNEIKTGLGKSIDVENMDENAKTELVTYDVNNEEIIASLCSPIKVKMTRIEQMQEEKNERITRREALRKRKDMELVKKAQEAILNKSFIIEHEDKCNQVEANGCTSNTQYKSETSQGSDAEDESEEKSIEGAGQRRTTSRRVKKRVQPKKNKSSTKTAPSDDVLSDKSVQLEIDGVKEHVDTVPAESEEQGVVGRRVLPPRKARNMSDQGEISCTSTPDRRTTSGMQTTKRQSAPSVRRTANEQKKYNQRRRSLPQRRAKLMAEGDESQRGSPVTSKRKYEAAESQSRRYLPLKQCDMEEETETQTRRLLPRRRCKMPDEEDDVQSRRGSVMEKEDDKSTATRQAAPRRSEGNSQPEKQPVKVRNCGVQTSRQVHHFGVQVGRSRLFDPPSDEETTTKLEESQAEMCSVQTRKSLKHSTKPTVESVTCKICDGPMCHERVPGYRPLCLVCNQRFSTPWNFRQHQNSKQHSNASVIQAKLWSGEVTAEGVCIRCCESCGIKSQDASQLLQSTDPSFSSRSQKRLAEDNLGFTDDEELPAAKCTRSQGGEGFKVTPSPKVKGKLSKMCKPVVIQLDKMGEESSDDDKDSSGLQPPGGRETHMSSSSTSRRKSSSSQQQQAPRKSSSKATGRRSSSCILSRLGLDEHDVLMAMEQAGDRRRTRRKPQDARIDYCGLSTSDGDTAAEEEGMGCVPKKEGVGPKDNGTENNPSSKESTKACKMETHCSIMSDGNKSGAEAPGQHPVMNKELKMLLEASRLLGIECTPSCEVDSLDSAWPQRRSLPKRAKRCVYTTAEESSRSSDGESEAEAKSRSRKSACRSRKKAKPADRSREDNKERYTPLRRSRRSSTMASTKSTDSDSERSGAKVGLPPGNDPEVREVDNSKRTPAKKSSTGERKVPDRGPTVGLDQSNIIMSPRRSMRTEAHVDIVAVKSSPSQPPEELDRAATKGKASKSKKVMDGPASRDRQDGRKSQDKPTRSQFYAMLKEEMTMKKPGLQEATEGQTISIGMAPAPMENAMECNGSAVQLANGDESSDSKKSSQKKKVERLTAENKPSQVKNKNDKSQKSKQSARPPKKRMKNRQTEEAYATGWNPEMLLDPAAITSTFDWSKVIARPQDLQSSVIKPVPKSEDAQGSMEAMVEQACMEANCRELGPDLKTQLQSKGDVKEKKKKQTAEVPNTLEAEQEDPGQVAVPNPLDVRGLHVLPDSQRTGPEEPRYWSQLVEDVAQEVEHHAPSLMYAPHEGGPRPDPVHCASPDPDQMMVQKNSADRMAAHKNSVDQMMVQKNSLDQIMVQKNSTDRMAAHKNSMDQMMDQMMVQKNSMDQMMVPKSPADQMMVPKNSMDEMMVPKNTGDQMMGLKKSHLQGSLDDRFQSSEHLGSNLSWNEVIPEGNLHQTHTPYPAQNTGHYNHQDNSYGPLDMNLSTGKSKQASRRHSTPTGTPKRSASLEGSPQLMSLSHQMAVHSGNTSSSNYSKPSPSPTSQADQQQQQQYHQDQVSHLSQSPQLSQSPAPTFSPAPSQQFQQAQSPTLRNSPQMSSSPQPSGHSQVQRDTGYNQPANSAAGFGQPVFGQPVFGQHPHPNLSGQAPGIGWPSFNLPQPPPVPDVPISSQLLMAQAQPQLLQHMPSGQVTQSLPPGLSWQQPGTPQAHPGWQQPQLTQPGFHLLKPSKMLSPATNNVQQDIREFAALQQEFECSTCNRWLKGNIAFNRHMAMHPLCKLCMQVMKDRDELKKHYIAIHNYAPREGK